MSESMVPLPGNDRAFAKHAGDEVFISNGRGNLLKLNADQMNALSKWWDEINDDYVFENGVKFSKTSSVNDHREIKPGDGLNLFAPREEELSHTNEELSRITEALFDLVFDWKYEAKGLAVNVEGLIRQVSIYSGTMPRVFLGEFMLREGARKEKLKRLEYDFLSIKENEVGK